MRPARSPSKASLSKSHLSKSRLSKSHLSKSQTYRRKAQTCDALAACARSAADREPLLRLRDALLARAAKEEWQDGLPPLPPVNANALARHA